MVINNGAEKPSTGILTKERPRFCREADVWLPEMPRNASQFYAVNLSGVKRNMVLFFKEQQPTPGANIVGVDCFEDGILTIKRMNPVEREWPQLTVGLIILAL